MTHELRTKSVFEYPGEDDGFRIFVVRWNKNTDSRKFDQRIEELAPLVELLKLWRHKPRRITAAVFDAKYRLEMTASPEAQKKMQQIREMLNYNNVTLLCYEKDPYHCHRKTLRELILQKSPSKAKAKVLPE